MKIKLFAFISLLISSGFAQAQPAPKYLELDKVSYSPKVPAAVKRFVPRGGKLRFWGVTNFQFQLRKVWACIYDVHRPAYSKEFGPGYASQNSGMDLFVAAQHGHLRRISTTRFKYQRAGSFEAGPNPETIGLQTTWLEPKSQQRPVFVIAMQDHNGT